MKILIIIAISLTIMTSCFLDPSFSKEVKNPYYLGIDYGTNKVCLHWTEHGGSGGIEKIPSDIVRIGWNDRYIVAASNDNGREKTKGYYILDTKDDCSTCYNKTIGPLSFEEYEKAMDSLGLISEIKFMTIRFLA